jgi:hypothetical protein
MPDLSDFIPEKLAFIDSIVMKLGEKILSFYGIATLVVCNVAACFLLSSEILR